MAAKTKLDGLEALENGFYIYIYDMKYEARRPVLTPSTPSSIDPSSRSSPSKPAPSLGILATLPDELLAIIIKSLNISDLSDFEKTNKTAKEFVRWVCPALAHAREQVPQILAAAVALDLPYSIEVLDKMLEEKKCSCCGIKEGYYLALLEQKMYCFWCCDI